MLNKKRLFGRGMVITAMIWAFVVPFLSAQAERDMPGQKAAEAVDHWGPLKLLVGAWEGEIDGKLGKGRGMRRYEFILGGHFLQSRHISVRLPQEKSPQGDQHEEMGVFSFDSERGSIVHREFLSEGVVARSPCQIEGMKVVCVSESVESGPGIRTRLTLEITDRYRFTEVYEIAWPGKELEHYFTNHWTRSPTPGDWR